MFNGGFHSPTQLMGLAQIAQDEEFNELCAAQRPAGGLRQLIATILTGIYQRFRAQPPVTQLDLLALATANQALEARVLQLERQLAAMLPTPP